MSKYVRKTHDEWLCIGKETRRPWLVYFWETDRDMAEARLAEHREHYPWCNFKLCKRRIRNIGE